MTKWKCDCCSCQHSWTDFIYRNCYMLSVTGAGFSIFLLQSVFLLWVTAKYCDNQNMLTALILHLHS